jgi:diadenosine tetraphosphate (Ap4A) HIT family hydrolase
MTARCGFCFWDEATKAPLPGWVEVMKGFMDRQPHPGRIDGLIPCDRQVFEDDSWFAIVEREPIAEGHLRLICKEHIPDLTSLRGAAPGGQDPRVVDAVRSTLLDDLIIAAEVVRTFDPKVREVVVFSAPDDSTHLHFDLVPRFRFDHDGIKGLGEVRSMYEDLTLAEKRRMWEENRRGFADVARRQREAAGAVIGSRPGRRRAGLRVGGEGK